MTNDLINANTMAYAYSELRRNCTGAITAQSQWLENPIHCGRMIKATRWFLGPDPGIAGGNP